MTKKQQKSSKKITKTCRMCLTDNSRKEYLCIDEISNNELRIKFEKCFGVKIFKNPFNFTYLCTECVDSLDPLLDLQKTVRRNENVYFDRLRKIYKCDLCSYQSCQKALIKKHIEHQHLNINFFSCGFCSKKISDKSCLKKHIRRMHGNYHCKECSRRFKIQSLFKRHMKECHS